MTGAIVVIDLASNATRVVDWLSGAPLAYDVYVHKKICVIIDRGESSCLLRTWRFAA